MAGWKMKVDLGRTFLFAQIVQASLRPDIVIWSEYAEVIMVQLWEEGCKEAHKEKMVNYQNLVQEVQLHVQPEGGSTARMLTLTTVKPPKKKS